jgi:2-dehydro-3-deoxyglucarate aldolase
MVIVQIESINALDDLDRIFQVEGVDGYIIGPYDLSCSMGVPGEFENSEFLQVMERIQDAGRRNNCPSGIHSVEPDRAKLEDAISKGFKIIAYSVDIRILDVGARLGSELNSGENQ